MYIGVTEKKPSHSLLKSSVYISFSQQHGLWRFALRDDERDSIDDVSRMLMSLTLFFMNSLKSRKERGMRDWENFLSLPWPPYHPAD